jgi:hypothetical protein
LNTVQPIVEFASARSARSHEAKGRAEGGCRSQPAPAGTPKTASHNGTRTKAEQLRDWRRRNPDKVREQNERRRIPPTERTCVECGGTFVGRKDKLLCSRRCKDTRYERLHPEAYAAKRRRKEARRYARRVGAGAGATT